MEPIAIQPIAPDELPLLEAMLLLFVHDLSEWVLPGSLPLMESGRFDWGLEASAWLTDPDREARWIHYGGRPVGMVLMGLTPRVRTEIPGRTIDAFFILRGYRRLGIGRTVWPLLVELHDGYWELLNIPDHRVADRFARAGQEAMVNGAFGEETVMLDGQPVVHRWLWTNAKES